MHYKHISWKSYKLIPQYLLKNKKRPEIYVYKFQGFNYLNRSYTYIVSFFFLHPDCTVGSGITPDHAVARGLTLPPKTSKRLPPVGNYTLPWRIFYFHRYYIALCYIIQLFFIHFPQWDMYKSSNLTLNNATFLQM